MVKSIPIDQITDEKKISEIVERVNKHILENKVMLVRQEKDYIILTDYVDSKMYMLSQDKNKNIIKIAIL